MVRNNPRLAVVENEYMNSVPSRPPEQHYQPPNQALHASIPDFSLLRIDSDERERLSSESNTAREIGTNDGLSETGDGYAHENDGLSSGEYEHENDGLSSDDDQHGEDGVSAASIGDIHALIMQVPKMNSHVVVPRWADIPPQIVEPTQDYSEIDNYAMQALGFVTGASPAGANRTESEVTQSGANSQVNAIPILNELSQSDTSMPINRNSDDPSGDSNMQLRSLSNMNENSIDNNQNLTVSSNDLSDSHGISFNLQGSQAVRAQFSNSAVSDNLFAFREQDTVPKHLGQGDTSVSNKRSSRTSSGGFSDIVYNNNSIGTGEEELFPTEFLNADFRDMSMDPTSTYVQAAGLLPSQPLNADINQNKSPDTFELPNLPMLHVDEGDEEEENDDHDSLHALDDARSRASNPQQLLHDMQLGMLQMYTKDYVWI